jgi:hypothetical protein
MIPLHDPFDPAKTQKLLSNRYLQPSEIIDRKHDHHEELSSSLKML